MLTRAVLDRQMVPWEQLENLGQGDLRRGTMAIIGIPHDIINGVSVFLLAAFATGVIEGAAPALRLPAQRIRVVATALAATLRAESTERPSTRHSPAQLDLPPSRQQLIRTGKMVMRLIKNFLDSLRPAQLDCVSQRAAATRADAPSKFTPAH